MFAFVSDELRLNPQVSNGLLFMVRFVSDAVDTLVYYGVAKTRKDAIHLGRQLAKEQNLFHHATGDHAFSDEFLFYSFSNRIGRKPKSISFIYAK